MQARATAASWVGGLHLRQARYWIRFGTVASAYVIAGKLGIGLSVAHGVITPVWAPSGIALAALLIFGRSLWPAVAVGAFVTNATTGAEPLVAAGIACGNTLEALTGSFLLEKVKFKIDLERVRDVLALVVLGAALSTLVSATIGISVLAIAGFTGGSVRSDWVLWWFGDAMGDLLVTPLLLLAYVHRRWRPSRAHLLEALLLLFSLMAIASIVFLAGAWRYPYFLFPLLLWAVLRFHQPGAAVSSFLVGLIATWGTVIGTASIVASSETARVQVIQALVAVLAISLLVLGAVLAEREAARRAVEQGVALLSEAQALTHIGSWEWDLVTGRVTWSDELYRIFGLAPDARGITVDFLLERVHPDDRARLDDTVRRAYVDQQPFALEVRIVLGDGRARPLEARGRVVVGDQGEAVSFVGTAQDIADRRQAEALRADVLSTVSHELRTPLASVLNFGLILRQRRGDLGEQEAARIVEQIVAEARRLDRILSDMLEVDQIRHGRALPMREATDIKELVEQVASLHRAAERVITVAAEPTSANVDTAKVERIVDNLIRNAVKHTPAGTPIALRLERRGDDLLIVVDDAGPGIPDDHKASVFEIFDRGEKITSNGLGTGIGLSLVARFAALHGGRAWVEDTATGGASVRVLLPHCVLAPVPRKTP